MSDCVELRPFVDPWRNSVACPKCGRHFKRSDIEYLPALMERGFSAYFGSERLRWKCPCGYQGYTKPRDAGFDPEQKGELAIL